MIKDIRSIILCKGEVPNINEIKNIPSYSLCIDNYFTFGDYDSLSVYKLDNNDDFLTVIRDKNSEIRSRFTYDCIIHSSSVVMSDVFEYDDCEIAEFWKKSKAYFGYTTIWLTLNNDNKVYSSDSIKKIKNTFSGIDGLLYKSLEHSGYVFFWKSNEMVKFYQKMECLSEIEEIGYYETIISINENYTLDEPVSETISKVTVGILGNRRFHKEPLISKTIHIFDKDRIIEQQTSNLIGQGVSQYVFSDIRFEQLREYALTYKKERFNSFDNQNTIHFNSKLYICDLPNIEKLKKPYNASSKIFEKYLKLLERYNGVFPNMGMYDVGVKSLGQLINLLLNMSFSCRDTALCLLLYSSLDYILDTIEKISIITKDIEQLINRETYFFHRILRGCWSLIENHNQGVASSRHNRLGPIFYEMNFGLLEYYNGFFKKVLCYLDEVDKNKQSNNIQKISCLIVPQICRRIKTYINDVPEFDSFLFVDVPVDMISEPSITIKSLVHEISHQWGDVFRCREKRAIRFLECIANEISHRLGIWNNKVSDTVYSYLKNWSLTKTSKRNNDDQAVLYIDELAEISLTAIKKYTSNPDFLTELIVTFLRDVHLNSYYDEETIISTVQERHIKMLSCDKYQEIVSDLYMFFRECYADLFLIFLLDISLDEYLEIVKYEIKNDNYPYNGIDMLVQRFVLVILALPQDKQEKMKQFTAENLFARKIKKLYDYLNDMFSKNKVTIKKNDEQFFSNCYNHETSRFIVEYLKDCWESMKNHSIDVNQNEIKEMFECAIDDEKIYGSHYFEHLNNTYSYILEDQPE